MQARSSYCYILFFLLLYSKDIAVPFRLIQWHCPVVNTCDLAPAHGTYLSLFRLKFFLSNSNSLTGLLPSLTFFLLISNYPPQFAYQILSISPFSAPSQDSESFNMSPGFQVAGAPSVMARLRGEKPVYPQSRVGKPGLLASPKPPSAFPKNTYNNSAMPSNVGTHLPSTPSNLGPYSRAHTRTQKPVVADPALPDDDFFENDSMNVSQFKPDDKQSVIRSSKEESKQRRDGQQGIVNSIASLSLGPPKQAEPVPVGRCLNWARPNPSTSSKVSKCVPRSDRNYPKPMASEYSISYKRRTNQTPMDQAGYREYLPFLRSEFKVGAIIRMNIHESDFKGTSKAAIAQASQASTLVDGGKRRKEHRHHGDFGPIYSENRIFIVVNVAKSVYSAVPLFTHEGKGLKNIDPDEQDDWISVQDHRDLDRCQQQSEHQPLCTAYMNTQADILDTVSTAWIPYAFPCRFDVPVAFQGRLDKASAERLVRLHRKTWDEDDH